MCQGVFRPNGNGLNDVSHLSTGADLKSHIATEQTIKQLRVEIHNDGDKAASNSLKVTIIAAKLAARGPRFMMLSHNQL